ncbi:MAG TPA: YicC/YloC family endoribonuclease [Thermoanaerobaculia bacterium]|jgi:uncharacterized protein (TIGR00255 family)|nr:YicC/YloC family endoribonuclease [Thermoanaerobaculia bacterium]
MRSMTGYGEASAENARHGITVSLRAVNHRFLDLQLRIGEELRGSEAALRDVIGKEVSRGRVEARVEMRSVAERKASVQVNMGVIREAHVAVHQLVDAGLIDRGLSAGDLMRLPEAFRVDLETEEWTPEDEELLLQAARGAVTQLVASREREGASLVAIMDEKLVGVEGAVAKLDALRGPVREEMATALKKRLAEMLAGQALDEGRLAQEVALLVDRCDVSEEIDRLRSHVEHFRAVMREGAAAGKRLDFLTQEVFRELNTLGAKCRNAEMTRAVLDAKVTCEQIREQVQNVE